MTSISLDLSEKIDPITKELYRVIEQVTNELGLSYVVVGATARDLVLHLGYGAAISRATRDVDFGIEVDSWATFETLKQALLANNFKTSRTEHRLIDPNDIAIDIVPFGALEDESANIQWPPKGDTEMNVLGFKEAHDNSIKVLIQQEPKVEIPVATLSGLAILKIISWADRDRGIRKKDALDFYYLLENYERVDDVLGRTYDIDELEKKYEWDVTLASAHLLGVDSVSIAEEATQVKMKEILEENLNEVGINHLVEEMCIDIGEEYGKKFNLLKAFYDGFTQ